VTLIGVVPDHVPGAALRTCPTIGVPEIVGAAVDCGGTAVWFETLTVIADVSVWPAFGLFTHAVRVSVC